VHLHAADMRVNQPPWWTQASHSPQALYTLDTDGTIGPAPTSEAPKLQSLPIISPPPLTPSPSTVGCYGDEATFPPPPSTSKTTPTGHHSDEVMLLTPAVTKIIKILKSKRILFGIRYTVKAGAEYQYLLGKFPVTRVYVVNTEMNESQLEATIGGREALEEWRAFDESERPRMEWWGFPSFLRCCV